eukprot:5879801-Alexandrium_andersonii.AAC.1
MACYSLLYFLQWRPPNGGCPSISGMLAAGRAHVFALRAEVQGMSGPLGRQEWRAGAVMAQH